MNRKQWIALILVLVIVAAGLTANWLLGPGVTTHKAEWNEKVISGEGRDRVVVIPITGTITEEVGLFASFSLEDIHSQMQQALEDPWVKAVVLDINSPGGGVVASDEIYQKVGKLREAGKPVVARFGTMAASGGYYIAAASDKIIANANTLTGSIGVIFVVPNYQELADWIGYREEVIKSGQMKDIGNSLREMTAEERAVFEQMVDEMYHRFVDIVAEGRNLPREEVLRIADGRIYTGQQALELGLVDELGGLDEAIAAAIELAGLEKATAVEYTSGFSLFGPNGALFGSSSDDRLMRLMQEMLPATQPQLMYLYRP